MTTPRRAPRMVQQITTNLEASLAAQFYSALEQLAHSGHKITTRRAIEEALEGWLARQDMAHLGHLTEQEIHHAQPE